MKKLDIDNNKIAGWFYHKRTYFAAFFAPVIVLFIVFAVFGYYPFGDYCPLVLDLNGQYIYYYEHLRDAFWGNASYIYSWSRNLGGEMMGIYGYYLASPFMLIICLLPRKWILSSVMIMQLAKIGTCGVTFNYYLRNSRKITSINSVIFSLLYALMSYSVVQLMDPMWLDGLIYLPLITFGIERLIEKGEKLRFIIPLALMFMAHFYIGWMVAIYCVLYFLVYYFFIYESEEELAFNDNLRIFVRFGISALTAGALAMFIIIPVYNSLKLGKFEFSTPNFSLNENFQIFDFFTKLLPESYDTVRNEGLPFVYCGMMTLFLIPLYFLNKNIPTKKKIGNGIMLGLIFISMYLSTIDLIWHGLQLPNWLPYRYSFIFSFFMVFMAAEAFERIEGITFGQIAGTTVGIAALVIAIQKFGYDYLEQESIWFAAICIIGYSMLIFNYKKNPMVKATPIIILVLVMGELFGSSIRTLIDINKDVVYSKRSSYVNYIESGRDLTDKLMQQDNSFYRTEKTFHRSVNDAMAFRTKGVSHSSSTLNAGVIDLLDKMGYASRGHYVKYNGTTKLMDDLLGIKYIMNKDELMYYTTDDIAMSYSDKYNPKDNVTVYNNGNALSVGYMVNRNVENMTFTEYNPFENQNTLLSTMLGEQYSDYFVNIPINEVIPENVSKSVSYGHDHYNVVTKGSNAQLENIITAPTTDPVYMYLGCDYSGYERTLNVWVNHDFRGVYFNTDNYCIKPIGQFGKGDNVSIITTLTEDDVYIRNTWFYYLDEEKLNAAIDKLSGEQLNVTSYSDTCIEGTVTVKNAEGKILLMTIPYEDGWNITVDGTPVEYRKAAGGLICFDVPDGTHTVKMNFFPSYLTLGIIISIVGLIALIVMAILERKSTKILLKRLYK